MAIFFTQVVGTRDPERLGLSRRRMMRLLAPQTQENPIYFHTTSSESGDFRRAVDQLAEVGFEMILYREVHFWSDTGPNELHSMIL